MRYCNPMNLEYRYHCRIATPDGEKTPFMVFREAAIHP